MGGRGRVAPLASDAAPGLARSTLGDLDAETAAVRALRDLALRDPRQRAAVAEVLQAIEARRRDHPLAYARLWDAPEPRTSQRRAAIAALTAGRVAFVLGGNRSGKSELGAQLDAAHALGRAHPDVVAWARWNGLPLDAIQPGPGRVWAVALTHADSRRYVRPKVAKYLPAGTTWRNRDGETEAEASVPGGGLVIFKAVQQTRDGFQGDAIHWLHFDEEPWDLAVFSEAIMRLADYNGHCALTMTPLSGWTPLLRREVEAVRPENAVLWLHGSDNPHVSPEVLREILARYGAHERAARERGEITALEGRVYAGWRRDLHVVPGFRPPEDWPRYLAIDWGTSVPTAILYLAYDPASDTIHAVAEWYRAGTAIQERAAAIRELEAELGATDLRWADPEDASTNTTLIRDCDLQVWSADKRVKGGINAVSSRLAPDAQGRPHLAVHDRCANLIREIEGYTWAADDRPLKKDDHALDALRYGVVGISAIYGLLPE